MDKGRTGRSGKVVGSGHSTRVEGLNKLITLLEKWPEVGSIRLGGIQHKRTAGRKSKRMKTDSSSANGLRTTKDTKRAKGGGGFSFRATRPARIGSKVTGIKCDASNGTVTQEVVLWGEDLESLKSRLHAEGYGASW
jgi:hypothetical protein